MPPIEPQMEFFPNKQVSPDKFVGRKSQLDDIFDQINNRNNRGHAAIYGSSGMGKTSLLKYIKSDQFWSEKGAECSEALIVYQNCEGSLTRNSFWREVLKELRIEAQGDADLQSTIDDVLKEEIIEVRDIRQILRKIGERNKFLLLLLDDYHGILGTPEKYGNDSDESREMQTFLSELRNLAVHNKESKYFSTVVAAFRKLEELGPELPRGGSPWYNHYLYVDLIPFNNQEIDNYFFNDKYFLISIPENIEKKKVLEMTGGYPALLQCAGYVFSQPDRGIDINTFTAELKSQTERIFNNIWRDLTKDEQRILQLIAIDNLKGEINGKRFNNSGIEKEFIRNQNILNTLEEQGVISKVLEEYKYNFSSSLIQDLVAQKFDKEVSDPSERKIWFKRLGIKVTDGRVKVVRNNASPILRILQFIIKNVSGN